jgi:hypothetical protein
MFSGKELFPERLTHSSGKDINLFEVALGPFAHYHFVFKNLIAKVRALNI